MKHNAYRTVQGTAILWAAISSKAQDKYSIEDQLAIGRAWCSENDIDIIDELVVRGFSRDYWTLADVVAAAAHDPEMAAFASLQNHIAQRDFQLFVCFDANRFGRTASLVHEVIGRITRDCSALVHTLFDHTWIDVDNAPMVGTLKALQAQQELDKLKEYNRVGMLNRAKAGKTVSSHTPRFHKRIRDDSGKEVGLVVNEDLRPLWTDLATVLLRGVSWSSVEQVLFDEFGHAREDGEPYSAGYMFTVVMNPAFWGHGARNHTRMGGTRQNARYVGRALPWIWDESVDPPEHVKLFRNVRPAVYSGHWADVGEQVKMELWRRYRLYGNVRTGQHFRFHGLLVCDECGFAMVKTHRKGTAVYMRCDTAVDGRRRALAITCGQHKYIRADAIQEFLNTHLQRRLEELPTSVFGLPDEVAPAQRQRDETLQHIQKVERRIAALVEELADASTTERNFYRQEIRRNSESLDAMRKQVASAERELIDWRAGLRSQTSILEQIHQGGGLEWFWGQDDTFVHQCISIMLLNRQLVVRDGCIIGTAPRRERRRSAPRRTQKKTSQ